MIYKIFKGYHETGCIPGEKKVTRKKTKLSKQEEEGIAGFRPQTPLRGEIRNQVKTELISGYYTLRDHPRT